MFKKQNDDKLLLSILKQNQFFVEQYINKKKIENIDYDENFESISKKNISDRDESYTDLLKHFVKITKTRNKIKEIHKWIYFWIIMLLTISFVVFIFNILNKVDFSNDNYINNLAIIVSTLVSFCSVIISVPLIITKYLFSSKEDKRIARIILHTQQHDIDGKKILEGIKNIDEKLNKLDRIDENKEQDDLIDLVTKTVQMADSGTKEDISDLKKRES